ncbi:uncharacterized protein LOC126378315 [Pectinophora gossypiella]|uniref:uncharacterized protein LOC126378315 n=1 Tax=Pectinophora gossypiella TaxID=13191 RepID=UPI00214EC34A|nr:uncharacterized protein LOC126378315 [Pectinophora gossypiella]
MAAKKNSLILVVFIVFLSRVESASLLERSYEYVMSMGKNIAPSLMTMLDCFGENDVWSCAKEKAGKILEKWDDEVDKQRRMWQEAADSEVRSSGRAIEEMPSKLGMEVEDSLKSLSDMVQNGVARALARKHKEDEQTINLAISTGGGDKKKKMKKKKKTKPPKIHLVHPMMMMEKEKQERGFNPKAQTWVIGGRNASGVRKGRTLFSDMIAVGEKAIDALAEHAVKSDQVEDGVEDKSSIEEQRGKKKKKKKAILKLLILGAVLKAKIGTLLQILSFKLQVKFFLIALIGLGINLARFWLDLKKQHQPPQKVIYYEHAQHQHHYDHEEEGGGGWGPWSRNMEDSDVEIDLDVNSPYRAHIDRNAQSYSMPHITRA